MAIISEEQRELVAKLTAYVAAYYGGTGADAWGRAFAAYDRDGSGEIDAAELEQLLTHAGVGSFLTIPTWVEGVMAELDKSKNKRISKGELESVLVDRVQTQAPTGRLIPNNVAPTDPVPAMEFPAHLTAITPPRPRAAAPKAKPAAKLDTMTLVLLGGAALLFLKRR